MTKVVSWRADPECRLCQLHNPKRKRGDRAKCATGSASAVWSPQARSPCTGTGSGTLLKQSIQLAAPVPQPEWTHHGQTKIRADPVLA